MQRKTYQIAKIIPINIVTVIFGFIVTRCVCRANGMLLEYVIWGISFSWLLFMFACTSRVGLFEKKLLTGFFLLCLVQIFGLFALGSGFAIKNTMATPLIGSLVIIIAVYGELPEKWVGRILYYIYVIAILLRFRNNQLLDNTFSGCFVFINLFYLTNELHYAASRKNKGFFGMTINFVISASITVFVIFKSGARTALMCYLAILLFFILLRILNLNPKAINRLYYVIVIGLAALIFVYIHISEVSWFQAVNELSRKYFDKNLNSSRGVLWQSAFHEITFFELIFGKGTGTLPQLERYQNSSFHNTYIQLIVQNGMLGLFLLLYIFRVLWKRLSRHANDIVIQFTICCFGGVLLYNCFECTLLQNKAFLGAIQWALIGLGVIRVRFLENRRKINGRKKRLAIS